MTETKLIELKYKLDRTPQKPITFVKYFKTWKSLDKFVMSGKIKKYKVKGQSSTFKERIINYTSVLWEENEERKKLNNKNGTIKTGVQ